MAANKNALATAPLTYIKRRHSFFVAHISVCFGPHRHISVSENHDVYNHSNNRGRRGLVTDLAQPCTAFIMCHHRHQREGLNHDDMMRAGLAVSRPSPRSSRLLSFGHQHRLSSSAPDSSPWRLCCGLVPCRQTYDRGPSSHELGG